MHPYFHYLLADITAAHQTKIPEEIFPQTMEEHFEEIDKWVTGEEPEHAFGYYCGLQEIIVIKKITRITVQTVADEPEKGNAPENNQKNHKNHCSDSLVFLHLIPNQFIQKNYK